MAASSRKINWNAACPRRCACSDPITVSSRPNATPGKAMSKRSTDGLRTSSWIANRSEAPQSSSPRPPPIGVTSTSCAKIAAKNGKALLKSFPPERRRSPAPCWTGNPSTSHAVITPTCQKATQGLTMYPDIPVSLVLASRGGGFRRVRRQWSALPAFDANADIAFDEFPQQDFFISEEGDASAEFLAHQR